MRGLEAAWPAFGFVQQLAARKRSRRAVPRSAPSRFPGHVSRGRIVSSSWEARPMPTYLALLRGINVGGKNRLPMKDLSRLVAEAGGEGVATYIQSGNVLFDAPKSLAARLPTLIADRIAADFGHRTPVVLRTAEELRRAVASNPFLAEGVAEDTLHVSFLADLPDPARVSALDP